MLNIAIIIQKLSSFLGKGHQRSVKAKKNILASLGIRGANILIGLYLVPLTLHYLNPTKYGIWLTLSSVIGWVSFFDIGLGNGLRNKFAISLARGNKSLAKTYVSTTYAIVFLIMLGTFLFFNLVHPFLNWANLLNADASLTGELNTLAYFVFGFFCLKFVLKLIGNILLGDQLPAANNILDLASQVISLVIIIILTKTTVGSLLYIGIAISMAPVLVYSLSSIALFRTRYRDVAPSIKSIDFKYSKALMSLGVKFFIIQIAAIILFATDNMIITQVLGPAEVTPYNISYKYFGMVIMVFTIVMSPFWSSFTEAYEKKEFDWIKRVISKLIKFWFGFILLVGLMLLLANPFYHFWIGDQVEIPFTLSLTMGLFVLMHSFNLIFVNFINGVGKLKLQLMTGIISILINIPLSVFFAKYLGMGSTGVILATMISISISIVLRVIQYRKIINNRAFGIWNK